MDVSMTCGDIVISVIISIVTGIFSGCITGIVVTKYYRKKDECIEVSKYVALLIEYVDALRKETFFSGGNISDEYIIKIHQFMKDNAVPLKYEWISLKSNEESIVNKAIQICDFIKINSFGTQMKIGWLSRDNYPENAKIDLRKDIDEWKIKIFLESQKLDDIYISLKDILKKYINT